MKTLVKIFLGIIVLASLLGLAVHTYSSRVPKQTSHERQLAYLKKHEQEIVDFVKSQNTKVDSVQIDWGETVWSQVGNGTLRGGGDVILVFGGFNHISNSSWRVDFPVEDGKIDMKNSYLGQDLRIGGDLLN